ncbi:twin-arginine translocase subunit TatC [Candidatus Roizmanbacteria bacterium]|nr:twin-arginine translocase subunit TatC [Candidatus Roizmanbacteria bacterium]
MDNARPYENSELKVLINKYSPYFFEIRKRILFTLSIFATATVVGFVYYEKIIKFVIDILSLKGVNIVFTSPFQFINLAISCGITTGLILVFPLIAYQILSFLKPALKYKEYRIAIKSLLFSIVLFLIGFLFGIFIMKWQIQLFLTKSVELGIGNILDISRLISTVLMISSLMGLAFQAPIIMLLLLRIGIIKHTQLSKKRLWVYLGSLFFTILLPLDSILADIFLALPLIVLFELTLLLNRIFEKRKIEVTSSS